ncbi:MAG: ATP-dependent DNA helicase RecG [Gammaproteobacteria bacterium]|nr:ATP-dependent DNA helicase RecG [Gammaproteobacteria bacterium]
MPVKKLNTTAHSAKLLPLNKMSLTQLKGVGPALAKKLANLNIFSPADLLFHLPFRYQDRTRLTPITALQPGRDVVIEGEILGSAIVFGRRRSLLVKIKDSSGIANLRFFHFSAAQKSNLADGKRIRCYGEARWGRSGVEMFHPEYKVLASGESFPANQRLTPVYPSTDGLQQNRLRNIIEQALALLNRSPDSLKELLPQDLLEDLHNSTLHEALNYVHHPPKDAELSALEAGTHPCQQRLVFEELLAHFLCLRRMRDRARKEKAAKLSASRSLIPALLQSLPFTLTAAQEKAFAEVSKDLASNVPMLRLLQGDVGSGKTMVAILAALQTVENAFQVAIMAPTEILAEQHFLNFMAMLEGSNIEVCFLSGKIKGNKRAETLALIASGQAGIIIGTHALFQDEVVFSQLGLLVIDEQHRFGVHQRLALLEKGQPHGLVPHQLVMTATPIPRTLMMSAYADLDYSVIDELPPGRTAVNTLLIADSRRDEVIARIREACAQGRQAYWVCTLIEESEALQCQAAEATYTNLQQQLAGLNVGLIHGRMKAAEKSQIMNQFKSGEIHLLVATTVIEVGVDVPNASLMIIENPERLGLAQLHQLRGRVGRGNTDSHCLLLYRKPLSELSQKRLTIMRSSNDGFYIAQKDLEIRGPGEVLGTRQTGLMNYRLADLSRDAHLQEDIHRWAGRIRETHPQIIDALIDRWLSVNQQYGTV